MPIESPHMTLFHDNSNVCDNCHRLRINSQIKCQMFDIEGQGYDGRNETWSFDLKYLSLHQRFVPNFNCQAAYEYAK